MSDLRVVDEWPQVKVHIETHGRLTVRNLGRFLQSLNSAARGPGPRGRGGPRIELVSISSGSIDIVIEALGLAVDAALLALAIVEFFRRDRTGVRVGRDLIVNDNATSIAVHGGTNVFLIGHEDVPQMTEFLRVAADLPRAAQRAPETIKGVQTGKFYLIGKQWWVELDGRPGLLLEVRDIRPEPEPLKAERRYRIFGEAYISWEGPSAFVLHSADAIGD